MSFGLTFTVTSWYFSAVLLLSQFAPSMEGCKESFHLRCRTLYFSLLDFMRFLLTQSLGVWGPSQLKKSFVVSVSCHNFTSSTDMLKVCFYVIQVVVEDWSIWTAESTSGVHHLLLAVSSNSRSKAKPLIIVTLSISGSSWFSTHLEVLCSNLGTEEPRL